MTGNPSMRPSDRHAVRLLVDQAHAEISVERQCELLHELNLEYGRRLIAERARNERLRLALIAAAAAAAALTISLVAIWAVRP